jgi:HK97 family phage portal protein
MSIIDTLFPWRRSASIKQVGDRVESRLIGRPQAPSRDNDALYNAYMTNEVVYSCIQVMSQAAVDPRLYVEQRSSGGDWEEIEMHPAAMLMRNPHPLYSEAGFIRAALASMHIAGRFVCEKIRATKSGPPVRLWPLDPTKLKPIPTESGEIGAWEWRSGSQIITLQAEDVIVWQHTDPRDRFQAVSPLSVAMGAIAGDTNQTNYINGFFEDGGVPSGVLTVKDRQLTTEEADQIRQGWRAKFRPNFGGNRRDIAVLDQNAVYQQLGSKLNEIQSEDLRSIAESRICMVFGVPPIVIYSFFGLSKSTYSNLEEAWAQFWKSKLTPWFKEYRTFLTHTLLREFEDDARIDGDMVRFQWDMSQVAALADDMDAISTRATLLWEKGVLTRNEARVMVGYDEMPDGDVFFADAQPAPEPAQIVAPDAAPDQQEPPPVEDEEPKQLPAPEKKSLTFGPEHVKAIDDGKEEIVGRVKVEVEQYLEMEYNGMADSASADGGDDGAKIAAVMTPHYRAAVKLAYDTAEEQLADYDVSISFDLANPKVRETISGLLTAVKSITGTTKEDVRGIIANGLERGLSIPQITAAIRERAPDLSKSRAEMIARTETADAYTRGAILAYEESGVVTGYEWDATLDNRTSQVCQGLNGQKIKAGQRFSNGGVGPPAHPNCRSVLLPLVD